MWMARRRSASIRNSPRRRRISPWSWPVIGVIPEFPLFDHRQVAIGSAGAALRTWARSFPKQTSLTMHRLSWLVAVVLLSSPSSLWAASKNVLLLISDNHTATDMGCYGHPDVRTPNLDTLAARGTRFTHAFATVASCGPS